MTKLFEVYLESCEARFEKKSEIWGNDAHKALFPMFIGSVRVSYDGVDDVPYPSVIVDDYLLNTIGYCRNECNEEEWEDVCNRAMFYNDQYAVV